MPNDTTKKFRNHRAEKSSMLRYEECLEIFESYLNNEFSAKSFKLGKKSGNKQTFEVYVDNVDNKGRHSGYIYENSDHLGYANPSLSVFFSGNREAVSLRVAILDHGNSPENNPWMKLARDRWVDHQKATNNNSASNNNKEISPDELAKLQEERALKQAEKDKENEFISRHDYFKERLVGVAVAQFVMNLCETHKSPVYHQNQMVTRPNEHPYGIKKQIVFEKETKDFLIIPNVQISDQKVYDFVNSDKFKMPKNDFGFDKNTVVEVMKDSNFKLSNHIYDQDQKQGTGIIPSRDLDGVTVNLQRFLVQPNGGNDKKFIKDGLVVGSSYVFDSEEKLTKIGYEPKGIIVTEGWATGLSINKALNDPEMMVVVSWQAGQLKNTVKDFADKYPNAKIQIACDNDCKSFIKMNIRESEYSVLKTKNTGLQVTLETLELMKQAEYKDRIGVLMPRLNYKEMTLENNISDFNDIELRYGNACLKTELSREINKYIDRLQNGTPEIDRVVKMYNNQALFFAEKYQLPINTINPDGSLSSEPYKPNGYDPVARFGVIAENKTSSATLVKSEPKEEAIQPIAVTSFKSLFDVKVNDDVKTDFDRKAEVVIGAIVANKDLNEEANKQVTVNAQQVAQPTPVANAQHEQKPVEKLYLEEAPKVQAMINPTDMTEILYRTNTIGRVFELKKIGEKDAIMSASERVEVSKENKMISAILDSVVGKHIESLMDVSIERSKNTEISKELAEIKKLIGANYIDHSIQTQEKMKVIQSELVDAIAPILDGVGMDRKDAEKILSDDISNRDIDTKRLIYKEIRSTLQNLSDEDIPWLKVVKNSLVASYNVSKSKVLEADNPSPPPEKHTDNGMSPS